MHHQRGLHRHGRAVAGIDALDLARDQPVGDIAEPGAAVFLRNGGAEQAERAHLGHDRAVEPLLAVGQQHARHQLVLRIAARGVAHHALFFGQLAFEVERVLPVERGVLELRRGSLLALAGGLRHGMLPGLGVTPFMPTFIRGIQEACPSPANDRRRPSKGSPIGAARVTRLRLADDRIPPHESPKVR